MIRAQKWEVLPERVNLSKVMRIKGKKRRAWQLAQQKLAQAEKVILHNGKKGNNKFEFYVDPIDESKHSFKNLPEIEIIDWNLMKTSDVQEKEPCKTNLECTEGDEEECETTTTNSADTSNI